MQHVSLTAKSEQNHAPELPIGRFLNAKSLGGNQLFLVVTPFKESALAHFEDLSDCDYFGDERALTLRAVGWLDNEKMFRTGPMEPELFAKLKTLLIDPWQPTVFGGCHACELCQFDPPLGHANLFVPNGSTIFVCPELIAHYIASHFYRPPDEFLSAVASCPDTRTMQYKKLLLESGGRMLIPKPG